MEDRSAWMYYIEFPSSRKNIQVTDKSLEHYVLEATTMKSQHRMTLEVMKEAMKEAIKLGINYFLLRTIMIWLKALIAGVKSGR